MSAARDRLADGYYNSLPKTPDNPGGMDNGGHVANFPLALDDFAQVAAETIADNDATQAAIGANNAATAAAIETDNDATQAAIEAQAVAIATSAAEALASKNEAGDSAGLASLKRDQAIDAAAMAARLVTANFPDRIDATATSFTEALTGDPATVASPAGAKIVDAAGYGYVYQSAGAATLAHKGLVTAGTEYVIEIAVEIEQTALGAGETAAARIRLQGLDKDYASTGASVTGPLVVTPVGVTKITRRFAYVAPVGGTAWPQPGAAVWLRAAVDINRKSDDSAAAAGSTARVRRMSIRDVTAVADAEAAAAFAAASAASVAFSSNADAIAGSGPGVMGPDLVALAIGAQAITIGGVIKAATSPGSRFLLCDGASYLKASYPVLAAVVADRYGAYTVAVPTVKGSYIFKGLYVEAALTIAVGTNGNIQTSPDASIWTERAVSTTGFSEGTGVLKLAAKYYAYGMNTGSPNTRCLVASANGTTGWADVTAFGTYQNAQGGIASMAYGVVNGVATVVAVGGSLNSNVAFMRYSIDEGGTWTNLSSWTSGWVVDPYSPLVLIANGVLAAWCPNPATFVRTSTMAGLSAVTGAAAAPVSVGVGNSLFVCVLASGEVYTSPDLLIFTLREPQLGAPPFAAYLGYVNGAHHFRADVNGLARVYATPDFATWYRVRMSQAVSNLTGPLRTFGTKLLAPTSTIGAVAVASFAHNPATEFPVPAIFDGLPSYIKAL